MTVNLEKKELSLLSVAGSGVGETVSSASAMLQGGDRNVTVLSCEGNVLEKRKTVGLNSITAEGTVQYVVTYRNTEGEIREKRTQSDFELEIPAETDGGSAQVFYTVKGTKVEEKDGRLDVSALIEAQGLVLTEREEALVTHVDAGEYLACKAVDVTYLSLPVTARSRTLLKNETPLPEGQYRVAGAQSETNVDKIFFLDGLARVLGTISVTVLLSDAENVLTPYTVTLPLDENLENNDLNNGMTGEGAIQIGTLKADVLYGEQDNASLLVEAVAEVTVTGTEQKQVKVLQDCYPLSDLPLSSVQEKIDYVTERVSRETTQELSGAFDGADSVLSLVQIIALELPSEGGAVEGLLNLTSVKSSGETVSQEIPFLLDFGEKRGTILGVTVGNAVLSGNGYKIPLTLRELSYKEESRLLLVDTKEDAVPVLRPGVTIRFPAPGESRWDVAKACRVRESALIEGKDGQSYMVYRRLTEA